MGEIESFLARWRRRGMEFVTDVVWNHTSTDSDWLARYPAATYNLSNSPHLIPAFVLDVEIERISDELSQSEHEFHHIRDEAQLESFSSFLRGRFSQLRLEQFRQCDVEKEIAEFVQMLGNMEETSEQSEDVDQPNLRLIDHSPNRRFGRKVNLVDELSRARRFLLTQKMDQSEVVSNLRATLDWLNEIQSDKMAEMMTSAVECVIGTVRYERIEQNMGPFSPKSPLCGKYFSKSLAAEIEVDEILGNSSLLECVYANNGWVMNWNPLENFVDEKFDIYLKRQLVVWSDSAKLRYGEAPGDCPALWERIEKYTEW